jgi:outer membrane receptor for ferric coprogen and ferric-rhodotorulic acid
MTTSHRLFRRVFLSACAAFVPAFAQTVPPPPTAAAGNEPLVLTPFEVSTARDIGYAASAAMSGTRTNEKLENLPNSITVMTGEFLEDLALNTYFDAVNFGVSTENTFNDQGQIGVRVNNRSGNQVNIRGLASVRQLRDGFPWYLVPDAFNTERIEFGRGPGGLAYGDVDAGGSINIMTKRATFQRRGSAQVRYDTYGTQRYSLDVNQPLIPGRLGLRLNAIDSEVEQFRQRAGRELQAYAAAVRWEPFKDRRTQIDVLAERGQSTNQVGVLGLIDQSRVYVRGSGTIAPDADAVRAGVQAGGVGMLQIAAANNAHNALFEIDGTLYSLRSTAAQTYRISAILEGATAISSTDPNNPNRVPVRMALPPLIAEGQDWGGGDNHQRIRYHAYTIELKHAFSERLNVLVAHNGQFDESRRKGVYSAVSPLNNGNIGARALHIDVNPFLPNPSGAGVIPNPNFEKYFTNHSAFYQPEGHEITNWRAQAVYDAQLPLGITQRVVVAGAYRHEDNYVYSYNLGLDTAEIARRGYTGASASFPNNRVTLVRYLERGNGDDALRWDERPGVTRFYRNDPNLNRRYDQSLTSGSVSLLGAYFGGRLRTSLGLSREHWVQDVSDSVADTAGRGDVRFRAANGSLLANDGAARIDPPVFGFDDRWTTNQTYGAVWKVRPWLALTAGYFESSQFSDNYGIDLLGRPSDALTGEGMDFSARFTLLQERLQVGATYFETKQENLSSTVSAGVRDELNPFLRTPFVNLNDYRDLTSQGWEYELNANLTRNWTVRASWSTLSTIFTRFFPLLGQSLTEARTAAQARGINPDDATPVTREFLETQEGNINRVKRATGSLATRYTFTEGRLRGLSLGVAARYASGRPRPAVNIAGVAVLPATRTENYIIASPFVSYRRKVGRYQTTLQLNVDNIGDVRSDQGNTWRWQRFTDGRNFIMTVTVGF